MLIKSLLDRIKHIVVKNLLSKTTTLISLFFVFWILVFNSLPVQGATLNPYPFGYDCPFNYPIPQTRPDLETEPTRVSIGIYLLDIFQLNEIRETFEAKFLIKLQWQDLRLAKQLDERETSYCLISIDDIWEPQAYVYNQRQLNREFDRVASVDSQGNVSYVQIIDAEIVTPLDLRKFPFDTQQLMVKIISLGHKPEEVEFVENQSVNGISDNFSLIGWSVDLEKTHTGTKQLKISDRVLPLFQFEVDVKRQSQFFIWKAIFPLLVLLFVVYLVFWLEPIQLVPQVYLSGITLLSIIAYQLSLPSRLPKVPYLTGEDVFLIGSMLMIIIALVETILTYNLAKVEKIKLADTIDLWMRCLFPVLLLGLILFAFWGL